MDMDISIFFTVILLKISLCTGTLYYVSEGDSWDEASTYCSTYLSGTLLEYGTSLFTFTASCSISNDNIWLGKDWPEYLGCKREIIPVSVKTGIANNQMLECLNFCGANTQFAALPTSCRCYSSSATFTTNTGCTTLCGGNIGETCGGFQSMDTYHVVNSLATSQCQSLSYTGSTNYALQPDTCTTIKSFVCNVPGSSVPDKCIHNRLDRLTTQVTTEETSQPETTVATTEMTSTETTTESVTTKPTTSEAESTVGTTTDSITTIETTTKMTTTPEIRTPEMTTTEMYTTAVTTKTKTTTEMKSTTTEPQQTTTEISTEEVTTMAEHTTKHSTPTEHDMPTSISMDVTTTEEKLITASTGPQYTSTSTQQPQLLTASSDWVIFVVIGVIGFLMVLFIVSFFIVKKFRNKNEKNEEDFEIIAVSDFERHVAEMIEKADKEYAETKDRKSYARRFSVELKKFCRSKSFSKYEVSKRRESILPSAEPEMEKPKENPDYNMTTEEFVDRSFRHRPIENQPIDNLKYMSQHYGAGHTIKQLYENAKQADNVENQGQRKQHSRKSQSFRISRDHKNEFSSENPNVGSYRKTPDDRDDPEKGRTSLQMATFKNPFTQIEHAGEINIPYTKTDAFPVKCKESEGTMSDELTNDEKGQSTISRRNTKPVVTCKP